ncbi:9773_t:CDS:2, partial [Acaulospora colombiana]
GVIAAVDGGVLLLLTESRENTGKVKNGAGDFSEEWSGATFSVQLNIKNTSHVNDSVAAFVFDEELGITI